MAQLQKRRFDKPDETRKFDRGQVDLINLGGVSFGRGTFHKGWKWSDSVKPIVKTKSCEAPHLQYIVSGKMHVVMDDGIEADFGAGDLVLVPPGHDAWIVGDETTVAIDIGGMIDYAKSV
jgi:ethanolamine utilization protein EutQ (cupin superfamily)